MSAVNRHQNMTVGFGWKRGKRKEVRMVSIANAGTRLFLHREETYVAPLL